MPCLEKSLSLTVIEVKAPARKRGRLCIKGVRSPSSLNQHICSLCSVCLCVVSNEETCHSTAPINNLLRKDQTVNSRTSMCSESVLFTTQFTHLCFCGAGSDVFRESDKGYFSPTLSCYFPGSFVWLRDLGLSVLRGMRGTFEPEHLWTLLSSYTHCSHTCLQRCVCVCDRPWT